MKHEQFEVFHRAKPEVYKEYKRIALNHIQDGAERISSKFLIETIRMNLKLKIQNNFTAYYSRRFIAEYPQFTDRFIFKTIR